MLIFKTENQGISDHRELILKRIRMKINCAKNICMPRFPSDPISTAVPLDEVVLILILDLELVKIAVLRYDRFAFQKVCVTVCSKCIFDQI